MKKALIVCLCFLVTGQLLIEDGFNNGFIVYRNPFYGSSQQTISPTTTTTTSTTSTTLLSTTTTIRRRQPSPIIIQSIGSRVRNASKTDDKCDLGCIMQRILDQII